jgi:hypothetical protein
MKIEIFHWASGNYKFPYLHREVLPYSDETLTDLVLLAKNCNLNCKIHWDNDTVVFFIDKGRFTQR